MKIRDLDLERYVIVYDIGKSECSDGMTIVGKVIELEFDDYDKNKAVIESMQNEYEITDDNEFELWTKSIEDKTESLSESFNSRLRKNIEAQNEYLNSLVKPNQSNDIQQRKRKGKSFASKWLGMPEKADLETYDFKIKDFTTIFIERIVKDLNPVSAYHIGKAIEHIEDHDIKQARESLETAYENWDVK